MKFTWAWLKDHLETDKPLEVVLERLPMLGLEVESVVDRAAELAPFTIARITEAVAHPNADSLRLCTVDTGSASVQVVCGAPNATAGLIGVFAPVGAYVPGIDLTLTEATIRGVTSSGMMCSEREMMLSDEHDGIIALSDDAPLGESFAAYAGLDDPVIEIAITPNRADCLGVRGIARDLAAAGLGTLKPLAEVQLETSGPSRIHWQLDLPKDRQHLCPRIAGRMFSNVRNGPSPAWMQQRLKAVGQRPISALVDITNFVMLDLGRPLHAYDADKIDGDALIVRLARDGEQFQALNEKTYNLDSTMLTIGDSHGADDLAGIMGGERTGVDDTTTCMFLEMAIFDPVNVATTGRKLNIHSDARYRFERGLDASALDWAMDRVSLLVHQICGGSISEVTEAGSGIDQRPPISYQPQRCHSLTGVEVSTKEQKRILETLGFAVTETVDGWSVMPPPWRGDIDGSADLVEEVIRIHGYDAIPETSLPRDQVVARPAVTSRQRQPHQLRRLLASRGMMESVTFSFLDAATAKQFGGGADCLRLVNPISAELDMMRPSLLPNLLAALGRNAARGDADAGLFEVGPVFPGDQAEDQQQVAAGIRHGMTAEREWHGSARPIDWADARADAIAVLDALGVRTDSLQTRRGAAAWYHPGQSGLLCQGKAVLASFGAVHPAVLEAHDLRGPASAFEVVLDDVPLPRHKGSARSLAVLQALQPVQRDFAFILDQSVTAEALLRAIRGAGKPLLSRATVFDVYQGKGIAEGCKSLAVAVTLQPEQATLTEKQIDEISTRIIAAVEKHCGGVLRG